MHLLSHIFLRPSIWEDTLAWNPFQHIWALPPLENTQNNASLSGSLSWTNRIAGAEKSEKILTSFPGKPLSPFESIRSFLGKTATGQRFVQIRDKFKTRQFDIILCVKQYFECKCACLCLRLCLCIHTCQWICICIRRCICIRGEDLKPLA